MGVQFPFKTDASLGCLQ